MPDSPSPDAERLLQRIFRKTSLFSYLALFLAVMAFAACPRSIIVRAVGPAREAALRFEPAPFAASGFAPLRLVGAWRVEVDDPRFGGVSGLAMDGGALLALTDSGSVIRFPQPGRGGPALVRDLPTGPGLSQFKFNRDSEALARDPEGRGWWVTFEHWHQAWLYDRDFRRALSRVDFGRGRWPANRGLEAIVVDADGLLLFPEAGSEWLRLTGKALRSNRLVNAHGDIADAVRLPDGRLLLVTRRFGLDGIAKRLAVAEASNGSLGLRALASLGLGATDNVEAIAAEPRANGTRLWLMTDNDFRARAPTYLVALDLP
jgi:hypothetical protein